MSLTSLYTIQNLIKTDEGFTARISFNPSHPVFDGHFPEQPVVPGVFLIRIIKDVVGSVAGGKFVLKFGSNIKFLNVIDPHKHPEADLKGTFSIAEDGQYTVQANISKEDLTFFKFKGSFQTFRTI
ncbi:MAG: 3-hydroxyacyl-ACP dehydratase [Bacteroidota bacterium]